MNATRFRGGGGYVSTGSSISLPYDFDRRHWGINATAAPLVITLPSVDSLDIPSGIFVMSVANVGANTFTVVDADSLSVSQSVVANAMAVCSIFVDAQGGSSVLGRNWIIGSLPYS